MHFADPNQREALDALSRIKQLRARLAEEVSRAREATLTAREIAREAERLRNAINRISRGPE